MPDQARPLSPREQRTLDELHSRLDDWFRRTVAGPQVVGGDGSRIEFCATCTGEDHEDRRYISVRVTDSTVSEVCE